MFDSDPFNDMMKRIELDVDLQIACKKEDIGKIHELIKKGASPTAVTDGNNSSLHLAVLKNQKNVLGALAKHKSVDWNKKNVKGLSPIHLLAEVPEKDIVEVGRFLLKNGADIEARDKSGNTAMHLAAKHEKYSLVEFLLNNSASSAKNNDEKQTPYEITKSYEIKSLILDFQEGRRVPNKKISIEDAEIENKRVENAKKSIKDKIEKNKEETLSKKKKKKIPLKDILSSKSR